MYIEKKNYSSNPWRLIDKRGREVQRAVVFDHPLSGKTVIAEPVMGKTKKECVENALSFLQYVADEYWIEKRVFPNKKQIMQWVRLYFLEGDTVRNQNDYAKYFATQYAQEKLPCFFSLEEFLRFALERDITALSAAGKVKARELGIWPGDRWGTPTPKTK